MDNKSLTNVLPIQCSVHVGDCDRVWENVGSIDNLGKLDNALNEDDALSLDVFDDHPILQRN